MRAKPAGRLFVEGLIAFGGMCLLVSGLVLFEEGNWPHTLAAWTVAAILYLTWKAVRWQRN